MNYGGVLMNNILNLIDEMENYFDTCKKVPISNKLMVDIEVIYEFMTDIRLKLPEEIKRAERIVEEKEKILLEAKKSANNVEREAEARVYQLINEHEIMKQAYAEGEKIVAEAKNTSREMKLGAYEYVDELLSQLEAAVKDTLEQSSTHYSRFEEYMTHQIESLEANKNELAHRKTGKKDNDSK
jgi:vacuolar-type H+-ATPase subunit E/Vma4